MTLKVLLVLFFILGTTFSSTPCVDVTHSECAPDSASLILAATVSNRKHCRLICLGFEEVCKFFIFDDVAIVQKNCRLYKEIFSTYIHHCNELAGPKISADGCDFMNPPDNSCQVYRNGNCKFGNVEETQFFSSWEQCQASCNALSQCKFWRFAIEEKVCRILYSVERTCSWQFSPRDPLLDDCDENPPSTKNLVCDIPNQQKHGDWFCPPSASANSATCHLECHPGYVSNGRTVTTCSDGIWSSNPTCVPAIGLISGSDTASSNTVEVYGEGIHRMVPNLPAYRDGHSLQTIDSHVILCGGYYTTLSCLKLTTSQQWTPHSTTTSQRYIHSSISILGQLHLLGGYSSPSTTEQLAPSTSNTWLPGPDLIEKTRAACATKIHPEVYIVTGGVYHPVSVISYNITSSTATKLQNLNTPRLAHGCVNVRDSQTGFTTVLVAGGYDGSKYLRDSEFYNLLTGQWIITGSLTTERYEVKLLVLGDSILAFGGSDGTNVLSTVDRFNVTTMEWSATEEMLEARKHHAVTGVPPSLVTN